MRTIDQSPMPAFKEPLHNIFRIRTKTPFPIGPVNSYLIKKTPYTLIDPGPDTDEARQKLTTGLEQAGVKPEQIERVVLTHYHTDHSGLARWLHSISGAETFVHKLEIRKLRLQYNFYHEFFIETGLSQQEINVLLDSKRPVPSYLPDKGVNPVNGV